jgi:hypothetical protein
MKEYLWTVRYEKQDESDGTLFQEAGKETQRTSVFIAKTKTVFFSSTFSFTAELNFH